MNYKERLRQRAEEMAKISYADSPILKWDSLEESLKENAIVFMMPAAELCIKHEADAIFSAMKEWTSIHDGFIIDQLKQNGYIE